MRFFLVIVAPMLLLFTGCKPGAQVLGEPMPSQIPELEITNTPLPTLSPQAVELGKTVYATHCAACHGADLEGEAEWKVQNEDGSFRSPPHDASGHTWHHGDPTLMASIRLGGARFDGANIGGTSPMPAFAETLTDKEVTAVLSFIKSTWPQEIRVLQQAATIREQKIEE